MLSWLIFILPNIAFSYILNAPLTNHKNMAWNHLVIDCTNKTSINTNKSN
ncbi:hypothetical protein SAMN05421740_102272 [Parapedobacter koreensis]|uniref:Uncharacterized protein n=1 Tax=Parapedobacter koreensis TaxID=332977 RepID=A0A1H7IKG2_9SPHI|nr:hypothetical protein SAMN05421740_102272 [Parapedobacter koreensis]